MFQSMKALYKKEILDIFRDKKTMLVMVLVPILLYPLLFLGATYVTSVVLSNQEQATYQIAFVQVGEEEQIRKIMDKTQEEEGYLFEVVQTEQWEKDLKDKKLDACITREEINNQILYRIQYLSNVSASVTAADRMGHVLELYREELRISKIEEQGLDVNSILYPLEQKLVDYASHEESFGSVIGMLVPFLMIVSILMGAIYAAIDVTAGEKERGTLETLLTLPVNNFSLIISKFLAVSTIASLSALLNFISMGMIGAFMYQSFFQGTTGSLEIHWQSFLVAIVLVLLCVVVFAMFLSALCMCVCIFTKSFKEAQNYSTPLLLIVMLVGYIGFLPDIELNEVYAVIPIANVVLLVKDIFSFQYSFSNLFLVLITNLVYSFLAVWLMSKMYNSENILFGEGGTLKLFERRANMKKGQMPGLGDAFLLLAVSVLAMFYLGSIATLKFGFWGIVVQQLCFFILAAGFAWYMKVDGKRLFSIGKPGISAVAGSLFLWIGCYVLMLVLAVPLCKWFPESVQGLEAQNQMFLEQPFWALFLVIALCPAICEEVLFRGFLFGTMKEKWKPWVAIVVSGVIFGVYHMSLIKALLISVLGIALAYSVFCSKSILCSILMHLCNNGMAVLLMKHPKLFGKALPFLQGESDGSVFGLLVALLGAVVCMAAGIFLLHHTKKHSNAPSQ